MAELQFLDISEALSGANMDWTPLGDGFVKWDEAKYINLISLLHMISHTPFSYRNYTNYENKWEVDFSKQKAAVAPYGGPVGKLMNIC